MSFEKFTFIVDKYIELGTESFELTPTIGDAIVLKDLHKYLNYILYKNKKVFYFTSLGTLDYSTDHLDKSIINNLNSYVVISIYGLTYSAFYEVTNSSKKIFSIYKQNLLYILNNYKNSNRTIIFRNRNKKDTIYFKQLNKKYSCSNFKFETYSPDSACTDVTDIKLRDNVCCNFIINTGCDINGNIKGCMYGAYENNFIIGNVFKDDLNMIYKNYFKKHLENDFCKSCILYDSIEISADASANNIINESYTFNSFINEENFKIGKTNDIK